MIWGPRGFPGGGSADAKVQRRDFNRTTTGTLTGVWSEPTEAGDRGKREKPGGRSRSKGDKSREGTWGR